ncbi:chemotaxis protein chel [Paracoccus sp. (in: a-proteobacteria)]|uniref:chemotaxis protein chel n=1 Tax=Paracoccus sp. TaxID=267 RepID=UPI0026E04BDD|nr:chemotaxis protein chel [Paracoccus sp. (in: a-proteobacteria)]MDO5647424.1 chemotaxis protein chel [Paracoccus sp. (in: a-proteobacteria)]
MKVESLTPTITPNRSPAQQLEQVFLEEMLKYAGPKPLSGAFSGGAAEDHFGTFLTREYAAILSQRLDLGLGARIVGGQE